MNKDILQGKWMQMRGEIKRKWGKLTDDEMDQINGQYDKLVGVVQERYGYSRDRAEKEVERFMTDYDQGSSRRNQV
jgi:uncharacterized protein YjbJ (UPF0337 family)